jgi:type IV secretion system protein VirB10
VLAGLGGIGALAVAGAVLFALQSNHHGPSNELYNTDAKATPDGLASLPRDYTGLPKHVPQLGPPLPGDLGRPILHAGAAPAVSADPEQQRSAQEREACPATSGIVPLTTRRTDPLGHVSLFG